MFLGCTKELSSVLKAIELLKTSIIERSLDEVVFQEAMSFAESNELYISLVDKTSLEVKSEFSHSFPEEFKEDLLTVAKVKKFRNINLLKSLCKDRNPLSDISVYDLDNPNSNFLTLVAFNNMRSNRTAPASYLIELILPYLHKAQISRYQSDKSIRSPIQSLTNREKEVLDWISSGKTNGEIGMILGISQYTVKNHVAKILEKLNAPNRSAAMALSKELGFS
ncbi:helix-turn-helix transcriptional regulator [Pseudoalteromonas luteoviolacea]|uniref:helix-turn-helix domain-containing protein n=1 Tax=Pseudoalteromonas luteoviolacea TaxID=43657 RepID=UPI001F1CF4C0|nr:helix-turn-helix transcriptional regulator [Pseudoalteromonas luteoviolacea]MCF6439903.1 helix-turn-helix transcriptional regulator [Pseudoalteromonas luteoviolacea]